MSYQNSYPVHFAGCETNEFVPLEGFFDGPMTMTWSDLKIYLLLNKNICGHYNTYHIE